MDELITLLENYGLVKIIIFLVLLFISVEWLIEKYTKVKTWLINYKMNYHKEESEKEDKEETIQSRFNKLEKHQDEDYKRIKNVENKLNELNQQNKNQNEILSNLSLTVRDLRLETMRTKILDSVPKCIDLTHSNIGSEDYTNLFQLYTQYEKILAENDMENSQCELAMRMIRSSYRKRLAAELLTDYHYLKPDEIKEKIRKADDAISWWNEEQLDINDPLL